MKKLRRAIGRILLGIYKQRKQKAFNPSLEHCLATARSMLKQSKYCFLISHSERQSPSARMVQPIIDFDTFVIWLGTNPTLRKAKEIEHNPYVTLAFGNDKEDANLIVYGKASIVRDLQERKKHWIHAWFLFFPGGPSGDDFVSIRVEPLELELMNFTKNLVPEPFGLKPIKIIKDQEHWQIQ
ncbi:MAG: stress protein [Chloroflexi bacterium AL-W]|nr:stress protein [Chloroflexi bacterium AL-N1]NOK68389.1 stress protein [Chloroflexi bacterium AL-N10]NOK74035.1 stress protein [Chloroflexi bacterium AL-N5]NOK83003.1 stress protein [Chloroflexi bacterium AL-W]NOK90525.1 stress protein [Chloroflexi bacterium AL-N15]